MLAGQLRPIAATVCALLVLASTATAQEPSKRRRIERIVEDVRGIANAAKGARGEELPEREDESFLDVLSRLDIDALVPEADLERWLPPTAWDAEAGPRAGSDTGARGRPNFAFRVDRPVNQFIAYFTRGAGRGTIETGLYRSGYYRSLAERVFREEGVPTDLVWLAQVESLWKPWAVSSASAKGLWQFIPSTGSRFGLERTYWVDDRADPLASTRAAARYLRYLNKYFKGDWMLALAAYNAGEHAVSRAVEQGGRSDFWYLYRRGLLPRETRNYVPAILATVLIAKNPARYGISVNRASPWRYDTVQVRSQTKLDLVADLCDTSLADVWAHNPDLRRGVTPPGRYTLRIPPGARTRFLAAYNRQPDRRRS